MGKDSILSLLTSLPPCPSLHVSLYLCLSVFVSFCLSLSLSHTRHTHTTHTRGTQNTHTHQVDTGLGSMEREATV